MRSLWKRAVILPVACALAPFSAPAEAQAPIDPRTQVGIDQKLNAQAPLDTTFRDETGRTARFGDYFGGKKPVVLVMPFYKCTGTCTRMLDGMARAFRRIDLKLGDDFEAVTVSINPKETPEIASGKKIAMMEYLNKPGSEKGWHFLTGDEKEIRRLADAVGYRYVYDVQKDQFMHPSGIMVLTPEGRMSRYFYGVDYPPKETRLALVEASQNKIGTLADKVYLFCTAYDPATGRRGFLIMRLLQISGFATVLIVGTSLFLMLRWERRQQRAAPPPSEDARPLTNA
jgi:protein SCO1/2